MKGYELEKVPKLIASLDGALSEIEAAQPKAGQSRGGLGPLEYARLSVQEILTVEALLTRAGYQRLEERKCPCEEKEIEEDLAHLTKRIAEALSEEGTRLYGLSGLAKAALALHAGLGLVPATTEDGTDWSSFSLAELNYLDAVCRKACGEKLRPPTHNIPCDVCGYASHTRASDMSSCPFGCSNLVPEILENIVPEIAPELAV